jgi:hypothetical protein
MTKFSKPLTLLILALWAGAAIMFAAVTAPTLFNPNVLDNRELSGAIAGAILKRFLLVSYYVFGVGLLLSLAGWLADLKGRNWMKLLFFICLLLFGANVVQDRVIRPQMARIKLELKNTTDRGQIVSLKNRFDQQHLFSTWLFGLSTTAALMVVVFDGFEGTKPFGIKNRSKREKG